MRFGTTFVLAAAAVLAGVAVAGIAFPPAAEAGDDVKKALELKKKRDAFRKKLKDDQKLPFFDLSYAADLKVCKDLRWTQTDPPPFQEVKEEQGGQFFAVWSPDITKGTGIVIKAIKMVHKLGNSEYSNEFKYIGKKVKCSDDDGILEGYYEDFKIVAKPDERQLAKCIAPKKRKVGPADGYASVWGTDPETKKPTRQDFYKWKSGNETWVVIAEFNEKFLDDPDILEKAEELIRSIKELKPPK